MPAQFEAAISSCKSVKDIRTACSTHPGLKEAIVMSIKPVKFLLESLFIRLKLKEIPFQVFHSSSSPELDEFWNVILQVDSTLTKSDTRAPILKQKHGLRSFLEHCCIQRHYMFSIKKCGKADCNICTPVRLPSSVFEQIHFIPDPVPDSGKEHYLPFSELYGTQTTEKHRPSLQEKSTSGSHGIPFNPTSQHASNTCKSIECTECGKQRVIYAARKLKYDEMERLNRIVDLVQYSCGSIMKDIECSSRDQELIGKVYIRANLTCADRVEIPYYSCGVHDPICIHCGSEDDLISGEQATPVYPTCSTCFSSKPKAF